MTCKSYLITYVVKDLTSKPRGGTDTWSNNCYSQIDANKILCSTGDSQDVVEHLSLFFFLSYLDLWGGESREEMFTNASVLGVVGWVSPQIC